MSYAKQFWGQMELTKQVGFRWYCRGRKMCLSHSTKRLFLSFLHYPQLGSQTLEQVSDLGLTLC